MNLWDVLKASKGIPVSDPMAMLWGYQYRKKHGFSELSGIPPLNFTSRADYLQDYRIYGNTVQNGTPAPDNPAVVQGCGEKTQNIITCGFENGSIRYPSGELFDSDERIRTTDFIPIDAGTYTLSWTAESDIVAALFYYGENKNLLSRYPEVLPFKSSPCTFSPISSTKYLKIIFMHDGGEGLLDPSDVTNIMINLGSSASSYEPYGYKIPVTVESENLAMKEALKSGSPLVVKSNIEERYGAFLKPEDTIVVGSDNGYVTRIAYEARNSLKPYPSVKSDDLYVYTGEGEMSKSETVVIPYVSGADVFLITVYYVNGATPSECTEFSPEDLRNQYIKKVISSNIYIGSEPLHKIGDYADYVDFERGVVVRRIKKLALTGDENITSKSGNAKWHIPLADMKTPINTNAIEWYCSHYQAVANNALWSSYDYMISWSTGDLGLSIGLRIRDIDFLTGKTAADLKFYLAAQYAAGTPVTVWYVLTTPEEEPLENLLPIQTIKGTNILTADTTVQPSEMYVKGKIKPIT